MDKFVKYDSVCIRPYMKDKKSNNTKVNNEEATSKKKKKKDVYRNLYCTNCQFISKFNPAPNLLAMCSHYLVEHDNIKIEDQIWPNMGRLAKVCCYNTYFQVK